MMTRAERDAECLFVCNMWKANDERNRQLAAQAELAKQKEQHWRAVYAPVDDAVQE